MQNAYVRPQYYRQFKGKVNLDADEYGHAQLFAEVRESLLNEEELNELYKNDKLSTAFVSAKIRKGFSFNLPCGNKGGGLSRWNYCVDSLATTVPGDYDSVHGDPKASRTVRREPQMKVKTWNGFKQDSDYEGYPCGYFIDDITNGVKMYVDLAGNKFEIDEQKLDPNYSVYDASYAKAFESFQERANAMQDFMNGTPYDKIDERWQRDGLFHQWCRGVLRREVTDVLDTDPPSDVIDEYEAVALKEKEAIEEAYKKAVVRNLSKKGVIDKF